MIRNHNWYNLNSTRHYPLDDNATGETDDGLQLPNNILLDCHIRYPETVGRYLYISSTSVTDNLVTLTFLASNTTSYDTSLVAQTSTFVPVAAITLKKPVDQYVHYALSAMYPGVGGWIVFGSGIEEAFSGKFATPEQTLLAPKAARNYRTLPVDSIKKVETNTALTGLVTIESSQTVEVVKATRTILGASRDVLVLRLSDLFDRNLLKLMRGSCGDRPESNACSPPGIELINNVTPDCLGNLTINFTGHTQADPYASGSGGVLLNTGLGLSDACEDNDIPDKDGNLPNDHKDECASEESASSDAVTDVSETLTEESEDCALGLHPAHSGQEQVAGQDDIYCENFYGTAADDVVVKRGTFSFVNESSADCCAACSGSSVINPSAASAIAYQANSTDDYNIAIFDSCIYTDVRDKLFTTQFKMTQTAGNGGIVINYRTSPTTGNPQFLALMVNLHSGQLELRRFAGNAFSPSPIHSVAVPALSANDWMALSVKVRPSASDPAGKSTLQCTLSGLVAGPASFTVDTDVINDATADGKFGLCSDFKICRWDKFSLSNKA